MRELLIDTRRRGADEGHAVCIKGKDDAILARQTSREIHQHDTTSIVA